MGWATPWLIGDLTPYPNGESREQMEEEGSGPSAAWVAQLSAEWRTVFVLGGFVNLLGAATYVALASDQLQPWARGVQHLVQQRSEDVAHVN